MKNILALVAFCLYNFISCNFILADDNLENIHKENNELKLKIEELKIENKELKRELEITKNFLEDTKNKLNTFLVPEIKYNRAEELIAKGEFLKAEHLLQEISETFKCTKYEKIAIDRAKEVKKIREKKEEDEKKLKELRKNGFLKIKQNKNIKTENTSISIEDIGIRQKVIYDRNGYEYYYKESDKDSKYISFNFTATSKEKNPKLPSIYLGVVDDSGNLKNISIFDYEFYKWSSYSTYLGNTHDMKNDFAKSKSIKFVAFAQINNDYIKGKNIVVFTNKNECVSRVENSYGNPPVAYVNYGCDKISSEITIEDFSKSFDLIHLFKKK